MSTRVLSGQAASNIQSHAWLHAESMAPSRPEPYILHPPPTLLEDGSYRNHSSSNDLLDDPIDGRHEQGESFEQQLARLEIDMPFQLEQARQSGLNEGTNIGFERGKQAGFEQALSEMKPAMDRMVSSIAEFATLRRRIRHEAEQDLVRLSLAVARKILHRELTVDPQALGGVIKAALERIDQREVQRIRIHPNEWASIHLSLQSIGLPASVEILSDGSLERGAVMIDTVRGELDGSINTQLQEIERGFVDRLEKR